MVKYEFLYLITLVKKRSKSVFDKVESMFVSSVKNKKRNIAIYILID